MVLSLEITMVLFLSFQDISKHRNNHDGFTETTMVLFLAFQNISKHRNNHDGFTEITMVLFLSFQNTYLNTAGFRSRRQGRCSGRSYGLWSIVTIDTWSTGI